MQPPVTIITPCYNEGICVIRFLQDLEETLADLAHPFHVIVVNDGSTDDTLSLLKKFRFRAFNISLTVLNLKANIGHQPAIYQGMLYARTLNGNRFIIMDADGEDAPSAIPALLKNTTADIVHVVRGKRRESLLFRAGYRMYQVAFKITTGRRMNFGNFCLIRRNVLEHAISSSYLHFAAFLSRQQCAAAHIQCERRSRIGGRSKMGPNKLIRHALKSFAEYSDHLVRLFFKGFAAAAIGVAICIACTLYYQPAGFAGVAQWMRNAIFILSGLGALCAGGLLIALHLAAGKRKNLCLKIPLYEVCQMKNPAEPIAI
jgi:polyisoprenyl-phosphate glycosyltransferase